MKLRLFQSRAFLVASGFGLSLVAQASFARGGGPDLAPAALERAFAAIGFVRGVERTIEGVRIRVEDFSVKADGEWIVIKILPRRIK